MTTLVSLRSAVQALELDEAAWVRSIFSEARGTLDEGLGTFVYTYRIERDPLIRLVTLAGGETAPAFWQALGAWGAENAASLASLYATGASTLQETALLAAHRKIALSPTRFEEHEVGDLLTLCGHTQGAGAFITVPHARRISARTSRQRLELERLSFELSAMVRVREHRRRTQVARLSASEKLVARRLVEGASDKEIAHDLQVSLSTVSTFVQRTRAKLGCQRGAEILALSPRSEVGLGRRLELFARLTAAECDVASALLVGSSYSEIAARRGVSERTVASQCNAIFRKCGVSGRRALAAALLGPTSGK
jgi:DNA-binding NarL/FixJ family response regulator